ncbi:hypothetical protein N8089_03015 [Flavobacteriales bacterium]|mgnify:CR=1 FL=1|nr:hypothetical protein [Flavobacteriales bacterium]
MKKLNVILLGAILTLVLSSCVKEKGCTDPNAINFDSSVEENDGSCSYEKEEIGNCLKGVELIDEGYFINIESNDDCQPTILSMGGSLDSPIDSDYLVSETSYLENGNIENYIQQFADMEKPYNYSYSKDLAELTNSAGEVVFKIKDYNNDNSAITLVVSSGVEYKYNMLNGNVASIESDGKLLVEYTYDNKPYFASDVLYDFFGTELDFQMWFEKELVPKNNIVSKTNYMHRSEGNVMVIKTIYTYSYNENNYPTEVKVDGETYMKFYYKD